jgi:hypothetical protein
VTLRIWENPPIRQLASYHDFPFTMIEGLVAFGPDCEKAAPRSQISRFSPLVVSCRQGPNVSEARPGCTATKRSRWSPGLQAAELRELMAIRASLKLLADISSSAPKFTKLRTEKIPFHVEHLRGTCGTFCGTTGGVRNPFAPSHPGRTASYF